MSSSAFRNPKRRRRKPPQAAQLYYSSAAAEERFLQQAIQNSKWEHARTPLIVSYAPVFYPTVEEFGGNPLDYIQKIKGVAVRYGICKIVPPNGWDPSPYCGTKQERDRIK
jgi:histone demethylase JARID1